MITTDIISWSMSIILSLILSSQIQYDWKSTLLYFLCVCTSTLKKAGVHNNDSSSLTPQRKDIFQPLWFGSICFDVRSEWFLKSP